MPPSQIAERALSGSPVVGSGLEPATEAPLAGASGRIVSLPRAEEENVSSDGPSTSSADPTKAARVALRAEGLVGTSPAFADVLRQVAAAAPLELDVLLRGPAGSGKLALARVLHDSSRRRLAPFSSFACDSVPESAVEAELFGREVRGPDGALRESTPGRIAATEQGTLVLENVDALSIAAQAQVLRLLEAGEYYPLGGERAQKADVRLVATTSVDPEEAVAAGSLREDLFHGLQGLAIRVPSLAERGSDLGELARGFCERACEELGLPAKALSSGAFVALMAARWPGNLRQLRSVITAGVIRAEAEGGAVVEAPHLFPDGDAAAAPLGFQEATREFQKGLVIHTLADTGWNMAKAARRLGVARSHIYNLKKAFGLERRRRDET